MTNPPQRQERQLFSWTRTPAAGGSGAIGRLIVAFLLGMIVSYFYFQRLAYCAGDSELVSPGLRYVSSPSPIAEELRVGNDNEGRADSSLRLFDNSNNRGSNEPTGSSTSTAEELDGNKTEGGDDPNLRLFGNSPTEQEAKVEPTGSPTSTVRCGERKPKLADGCWAVYLDIGSNIGVQVRKLFEGEKYPIARVLPFFLKHFGNHSMRRQPGRVCAIGIEANPMHFDRLKRVEKCHQSKGWRSHFVVPRAVLNDDNQTIDFVIDKAPINNYWGSSMFTHKKSNTSNVIKVPTIHMGRFIKEEVAGRSLPEGYDTPGPVYAKFDIEGAEYQTFGGLITTGAVCDITEASIEFHEDFLPKAKLAGALAIKKIVHDLSQVPQGMLGCKTMDIDAMDDEKYVRDGMPAPDGCTDL